jgi:hypothetical protein
LEGDDQTMKTTKQILCEKGITGRYFSVKGDFDCEHNQSCLYFDGETLFRMFNVINTPKIEGVIVCGSGLSGLWLMEKEVV